MNGFRTLSHKGQARGPQVEKNGNFAGLLSIITWVCGCLSGLAIHPERKNPLSTIPLGLPLLSN